MWTQIMPGVFLVTPNPTRPARPASHRRGRVGRITGRYVRPGLPY